MICLKCGKVVDEYANGKKCRECYNAYMRDYMLKRYYLIRAYYIEKLGGVCVDCGTTESLEFDHAHPFGKRFAVGSIILHSKEKRESELSKCVLRCSPCHRKRGGEQKSVEHGGGVSGRKNCPCAPCKTKKREYMRNWKANKKAEKS